MPRGACVCRPGGVPLFVFRFSCRCFFLFLLGVPLAVWGSGHQPGQVGVDSFLFLFGVGPFPFLGLGFSNRFSPRSFGGGCGRRAWYKAVVAISDWGLGASSSVSPSCAFLHWWPLDACSIGGPLMRALSSVSQ